MTAQPNPLEAVEQLEALARAATPGPWAFMGAEYAADGGIFFCVESQSHDAVIGEYGPDANDAAFIAAANPETILALISTLRSQAEALETAKVERDLYRIVAVNQGWNWRMCDAYGREEYQKHREDHVDECVAVALSHQSRAALTPEVKP